MGVCLRLPQAETLDVTLQFGGEKVPLRLDVTKAASAMAEGFGQIDAALAQDDKELAGLAFAALTENLFGAEIMKRVYDFYRMSGDAPELYLVPLVMKTLYRRVEKGLKRAERRRLRAYR